MDSLVSFPKACQRQVSQVLLPFTTLFSYVIQSSISIDVFFYKRKFYKTLREATRIIAISECTKRDILYYGDFPEDRIDLVYQSCGTRFSQPVPQDKLQEARMKYQLPQRYVLNVGTVEARKNILWVFKPWQSYLQSCILSSLEGRRSIRNSLIQPFVS